MQRRRLREASEHASIVMAESRIARTAGKRAATEFVVSQAIEFGDKYRCLLDSFRAIVDTVGYVAVPGARLLSKEVVIDNEYEHSQFGRKKLSAQVLIEANRHTYAQTGFYINVPDGWKKVANEYFWTVGNSLSGGTPFLDDPSGEWVRDPSYHRIYTTETPAKLMESVWRELGPVLNTAQDTQALLWESMQNPALNYDIASAAVLAHHDLRANRELTRQ